MIAGLLVTCAAMLITVMVCTLDYDDGDDLRVEKDVLTCNVSETECYRKMFGRSVNYTLKYYDDRLVLTKTDIGRTCTVSKNSYSEEEYDNIAGDAAFVPFYSNVNTSLALELFTEVCHSGRGRRLLTNTEAPSASPGDGSDGSDDSSASTFLDRFVGVIAMTVLGTFAFVL
eukprot:scaffold24943_cov201-Cylindrotheca_fusiformis.AAC.1